MNHIGQQSADNTNQCIMQITPLVQGRMINRWQIGYYPRAHSAVEQVRFQWTPLPAEWPKSTKSVATPIR